MTCDRDRRVLFWCASEIGRGNLLGMYVAHHVIGAVFWEDVTKLVLADSGGASGHAHFYQLKLNLEPCFSDQ
jgi:hypothetical protein